MPTSVRTKAKKKQPLSTKSNTLAAEDGAFEQSILALENACLMVLETRLSLTSSNPQSQFWQQIFINIANPVSLALMECKGPRHFHYHYRHRKDDESILHPVLENPIDMLAQVCEAALTQSRAELLGLDDMDMIRMRAALEVSLLAFLSQFKLYCRKI